MGIAMPVVRNSFRAFIGALLVLVAFHGVMSALGLGVFLADKIEPPSPDRALLMFVMRVGLDAALLAGGHYALRSYWLATRTAYALMGAAAAAISYSIALSCNLDMMPPLAGTHLTAALLPMLVGVIAASLYAQFAGRELVQGAPGRSADNAAPSAPKPPVTFDGPVQVRTSVVATLIASTVPAATVALIIAPFAGMLMHKFDPGTFQNLFWANQINRAVLPAYFFMFTLFATAIPSAIIVGIIHGIARAARRTRGVDYAAIGAGVVTIALLAMLIWLPLFFFLPFVIVGALMGAIYRRFAGIEPLALPEAVLATDPATLVGEDDPSRRTRVVIMNG
jgi:hypothetical protein